MGFYSVKNCAEVWDFAGCAAGKPRKPVPCWEHVTGVRTAKANAEGTAQRHSLATSQWSRRGGV
ncbi:hypothetical protein DaDZ19_26380 [Dickeya ananatis]